MRYEVVVAMVQVAERFVRATSEEDAHPEEPLSTRARAAITATDAARIAAASWPSSPP